MVISKIKKALSANDEKFEVLYHKYSKVKLQNDRLKSKHLEEMKEHKEKIQSGVAKQLIKVYDNIEDAKNSSFKVNAVDKDLQRLLLDVNKTEKSIKELMKQFSLEEVTPSERFYDPELHEIATYQTNKGMAKGLLLKTVKKGFKYRGKLIRKPKVIITK